MRQSSPMTLKIRPDTRHRSQRDTQTAIHKRGVLQYQPLSQKGVESGLRQSSPMTLKIRPDTRHRSQRDTQRAIHKRGVLQYQPLSQEGVESGLRQRSTLDDPTGARHISATRSTCLAPLPQTTTRWSISPPGRGNVGRQVDALNRFLKLAGHVDAQARLRTTLADA